MLRHFKGHRQATILVIKHKKYATVFHTTEISVQQIIFTRCSRIIIIIISNLSNDRSKASSKTIPPHSAI